MSLDNLLNIDEVCSLCGIGRTKFYELTSIVPLKRLPHMRLWRTKKEWVDEWLEELGKVSVQDLDKSL